eukprot:TRINITY_DN13812_c0_g1_i5.p1 TRINITY_DN13812_c0_g1~~TRINITY_DN13812_c0_g1_i5.p1  ORF type:complete len:404 (-),score=75.60 TRINITY_DN13812_c0_g1_i5:745-1956(-)
MGKSEKRKADKATLKATETPEERHARRLAKKKKKHGEDAEHFGYKNKDNRFGDANLQEQFTWRKKIDKMVATGHDPRELSREGQRDRKRHMQQEIDKLKQSREERDKEKELMDEERERLSRERESLHFQEWEQKEEEFHRQQSRARTEIRIAKGRARPIDMLTRNLLLDEHFDMEQNEPYKVLRGLSLLELGELVDEMQTQAGGEFSEYWDALIIIAHDESEMRETQQVRGVASHGMHKAVQSDLDIMLQGKSLMELNQLATEVTTHIEGGGGGDVEYWESLMKRLKIHRAKAHLRDFSQDLLRRRLKKLGVDGTAAVVGELRKPPSQANPVDDQQDQAPVVAATIACEIVQGDWSPELVRRVPEEDEDYVMTEEADLQEIQELRRWIENREASKVCTTSRIS